MTPREFVNWLIENEMGFDPDKEMVWGQSEQRTSEFVSTDFTVVDGQLFMNTYEGM